MKPISLVIDGINSFFDRQEVDFRFDGLFCISGDTGSGKTTILDCIIIALYGSGKRASVLNDYINLKRDRAEIRLTFETVFEGERQTFEVTRTLVKGGASRAKLVNITTGETLAEQTGNVNAMLEGMIGLTRDDFTQVVILEQGKFAKFLTATKKERNETVGNLFKLHKYRELGSKFGSKMKEVKKDIDNLDERLGELKSVTSSAVTECERSIKAAVKKSELLGKTEQELTDEISALEEQKRKSEKCAEAKRKLIIEEENLRGLKVKLEDLTAKCDLYEKDLKKATEDKAACELISARASDLLSLTAERDKRTQTLNLLRNEWKEAAGIESRLKSECESASRKADDLKKQLALKAQEISSIANLGEIDGYFDAFDIKSKVDRLAMEVKRVDADYEQFDKKVKELLSRNETNKNGLLAVMQRLGVSSERRDKIKNEVNALRLKREKQRIDEAAEFLRGGLKTGDVCPVCGNKISEVVHCTHDDVSELLAQKEKELIEAEKECMELENNKYSFNTRLEESDKALIEAQSKLAETEVKRAEVVEILKVPDKIDKLCSLAAMSVEVQKGLNLSESELKVIMQKLKAASDKTGDIKRRGETERAELNRLISVINERTGVSEAQLKENAKKLDELNAQLKQLTELCGSAKAERDNINALYAASQASVKLLIAQAEEMQPFDIKLLEEKTNAHKQAKAEREQLIALAAGKSKELEIMQKDLAKKRDFEAEKSVKKQSYDIYSDIYKLVSGDKFIEYIAEEYILQFTSSASLVLNDITGGKYTLEYEGGVFYVRDFLSDGMRRKASTLSGGETFLASLSLSIAISREIARYKTYEFFFLDEGFGTLDAYSLDTVTNALLSLSRDTLVGVVTHRPELTERIFDKITVLSAGAERGSIITRTY